MSAPLLKKKVLIVDDEACIRDILKRYFARKGFEVFEAHTKEMALQAFAEHRPNIVLLDILMPDYNGLEMLKELKTISPAVKVIMISGVRDEAVFRQCLQFGALDYIVKPFELWNLDVRVFGKLLA